jgi:hypothetical protein
MEFGLIPTPTKMDSQKLGLTKSTQQKAGSKHSVNLSAFLKMCPTPTTQEIEHSEIEATETGRRKTKDGKNSHSIGLADTVRILATPRASDWKGASKQTLKKGRNPMTNSCMDAVGNGIGTGLKLQPSFVEWLMGYPIGWTDIT